MRRMRTLFGAIAISGAALLAGLVSGAPADTTFGPACPNGGLFTGNVSLTVLAPTPNEVVTGPDLALEVVPHGYVLDDYYAGSPPLACIGHYHEYLDGQLIDMTPLQDPTRDAVSMVGVQDGPHVLTLVPAESDHTIISAKAVSIPFSYEGPYLPEPAGYSGTGTPSITITSPAPGSTVVGKSFTMSVRIGNWVLCAGCFGKPLVAGEGHWHAFEDVVDMPHMRQMAGTNTVTVPVLNYPPGWHTFYAVLTDNHHMPVMGVASDSVSLYVK